MLVVEDLQGNSAHEHAESMFIGRNTPPTISAAESNAAGQLGRQSHDSHQATPTSKTAAWPAQDPCNRLQIWYVICARSMYCRREPATCTEWSDGNIARLFQSACRPPWCRAEGPLLHRASHFANKTGVARSELPRWINCPKVPLACAVMCMSGTEMVCNSQDTGDSARQIAGQMRLLEISLGLSARWIVDLFSLAER